MLEEAYLIAGDQCYFVDSTMPTGDESGPIDLLLSGDLDKTRALSISDIIIA